MTEYINSFWSNAQKEFAALDFSRLAIYAIFIALIVHIGCIIYIKVTDKSISIGTEILIIALLVYTGLIVGVSYFNRAPNSQAAVIQLKPLTWEENVDQNMTNILNVLAFLIWGFLVAAIDNHKKIWSKTASMVGYSFVFGLILEVAKYVTRRGYFEFDNIEGSIIGAVVGCLIVCGIDMLIKKHKLLDEER